MNTDKKNISGNPAVAARAHLDHDLRTRPLRRTFRYILLVVFLIFIFAVVRTIIIWSVCNAGMQTAASLEHQGLPTLKSLALLQEDLALYQLDSYECLFAREGEKAAKAKALLDMAIQTRAELEYIKTLLPEGEGLHLASNLENAFANLDIEFRNVQKLVDPDFAAAMKAMDRDIPPLTQRVNATADAFSFYGYEFSGAQANATFTSFASIKRTAVIFGIGSSVVAFGAFIFVLLAARRSRTQLSQTLAQVEERTAELANSQALYQSLVDQLPAGIFRKDAAGRFVFVNSWFCRIKGMKADQILGRTASEMAANELQDPTTKWQQEMTTQGSVHHELIMQTGQTIEVKELHSNLDDKTQSLLVTKSPVFDSGGKIVGTQGMLFDVTEREQAEAELAQERNLLRTMIDNLPEAIYIKDLSGRKTLANPAELKNMGCKTEAEALGKGDFDIYPQELAAAYFADDQAVIRTGHPLINREEKLVTPAGETHWVLSSKIPLRDTAGNIIGLVGVGRDITAIKQAEARLEQVHKQLLETSRQAGMAEIATNVLHNVGNVLNSVNVSASLVTDRVKKSKASSLVKVAALLREHEPDLGAFFTSDPRAKQLSIYLSQLSEHLLTEQKTAIEELDSLVKNIEHIKDIVTMQQSYARVSGLKEIINIRELVEDGLNMNVGALGRHRIDLIREFEDVPLINIEKHKVLQILVNLIRNAKHACQDSDRPDKRLTVNVAGGAGRIKISVMDNGVGIPPENMARIFNHGFTTRKDGHGFGLHSGALAAKEMGGSLIVESEGRGRGAVFTLELPVELESPAESNIHE